MKPIFELTDRRITPAAMLAIGFCTLVAWIWVHLCNAWEVAKRCRDSQ